MGPSGASGSSDGKGKAAAGREDETPLGQEEDTPANPLPMSTVVRMMRQVLAGHAKVSYPAKSLAQGCAAEFLGAVVGEAAKRCRQEERHVLTPEDLAWALRNLGLDRFVGPMGTYLRRYREAAVSGSGTTGAVEDLTDEELLQVLAQMMNGGAGGNSSRA